MERPKHPTDYETGRPPKEHYRENSLQGMIRKPVVYIPVLLILALLVILLILNNSKNNQIREAQEQAAQEKEEMVTRANQRLSNNTAYFLKTLMMPFSWAVRTAMLSGNVEQVDQYLYQFVQEKNFELILVTDAEGKVISATNQKYTGESFADHFEASLLNGDDTVLNTTDSTSIKVATPIMGLNSKLGTLYAVYKPDRPLAVGNK
ncbi:hypothetical protein H9Q13_11755 [Pontibacter sp. JH31]|uniref:Histidine kinase n=1 Tax=Pontibacter aquaedesilientis TaxID=2766980 RepID=A0ABR7XKC5_9BACT|nr:hypothetical protein [Pontibacter aquaedesilientis]MBD1397841.1 hypothetical protein [Pontibacter aquaedesilientis]